MAKRDFISGSIFEFKVPMELGYAYCKVLDFRYIREIDGVLAKVYDLFIKKPINDICILNDFDWLFGARRLYDIPNSRGKGAWKFRGVLISKDNSEIPDFKESNRAPLIKDEATINKWYVIRNINELSYNDIYSHEQVKHLEDAVIDTTTGIEIRTAMEYYRTNNLDIAKDFDLENIGNYNTYLSMINIPIYSTIPKEIRGKAITK